MRAVLGGRRTGRRGGAVVAAALALLIQGAGNPARAAGAEPALTGAGPEMDYVRAAHARIHRIWHDQYLSTMSALDRATEGSGASVGAVTLALEVRWDGSIAGAEVVSSSGDSAFDQAAIGVLKTAAPLPVAAHNLLSDDGFLHLIWTLSRDDRACAAGAKLVRLDDPLELALPKLVAAHRFEEGVRRVQATPVAEREAATDQLARLWLAQPVPSARADVRAASVLARHGDRRQEARLRAGLGVPLTANEAAAGLEVLGIDVCTAVAPLLESNASAGTDAAMAVLGARAERAPEAIPCADQVVHAAANPSLAGAVRARLVSWVARDRGPAWKNRYATYMADKAPAVRAAALLASAKRGGGRPEMYRLVEFLHDPAVELRGAASAGLVRAGGDQALDQLYLLIREKDPRPYAWVSEELGAYATPATAELLGKLLKRGGVAELPAARALASRHDAAARAIIDPVLAEARAKPESHPALAALVTPPKSEAGGAALPAPYRELLVAQDTPKAADWLLTHLPEAEPLEAVPLLCGWLDRHTPGLGAPAQAAEGTMPRQPVASTALTP